MTAAHIAFLVESGPDVGLGHLSRCRALAQAALGDGARATFLVAGDRRARAFLADVAAEVEAVAWPPDPAALCDAVRRLRPDVVVVDSYAVPPGTFTAVRRLAQVVAIDDLADRPLPVDVVVNGSAAAEGLHYVRGPDTLFLLGARYALLDPGYAATPRRRSADRVERLLICFGGSLQSTAVRAALEAAGRALDGCAVDVAAGSYGEDIEGAEAAPPSGGNRVVVHRHRFGLRELMLGADAAISGAGVTLSELAATATPTVAVAVAANQRSNLEAFARAGAALAVDARAGGLGAAIESSLRRIVADRALRLDLGKRARDLVDGQGASRVAQSIASLVVSRR